MRKIKLNSKRQLEIRFNIMFNKKSQYLKNLSRIKTNIIKDIENEKEEILIDKVLGKNKFERDYSFFSFPLLNPPSSTKEEVQSQKLKFVPNLKVLITSSGERIDPDRYKPKEYSRDKFSNIYKKREINNNTNDNIIKEKNNYINGYYYKKNTQNCNEKNNYKYKNEKVGKISSLLTDIGRSIIIDPSNKEDFNTSIKRKKVFNSIIIK